VAADEASKSQLTPLNLAVASWSYTRIGLLAATFAQLRTPVKSSSNTPVAHSEPCWQPPISATANIVFINRNISSLLSQPVLAMTI